MKKIYLPLIALIFYSTFIANTYAVPPPDFIMQVASQLVSFFTIGVILLSGLYATGIQFIKSYYQQYRRYFLFIGIPIIILVAGVSAYYANSYYQGVQQTKYNQQWIEESTRNQKDLDLGNPKLPGTGTTMTNESTESKTVYNQEIWARETNMADVPFGYNSSVIELSEGQMNQEAIESKNNQKVLDSNSKITNEELRVILKDKKYTILDARENLEYDIGHIPGSIHIRFADIKDSHGSQIPKDTNIYIVCWSGMRGKEVSEYLTRNNIPNRYIENGVNGWIEAGGNWEGESKFSKIYGKQNYSLTLSTEEVKNKIQEGAVLVDSRSLEKYNKKHISGAINIPLMGTPTHNINNILAQVPNGGKFIVICDDYINCFDAKLTGIELEKRGAIFLGRYNKPWEF